MHKDIFYRRRGITEQSAEALVGTVHVETRASRASRRGLLRN